MKNLFHQRRARYLKAAVLIAHAAALGGVKIAPEKAGSLFPKEWRKQ
jgi:hypothetical protein